MSTLIRFKVSEAGRNYLVVAEIRLLLAGVNQIAGGVVASASNPGFGTTAAMAIDGSGSSIYHSGEGRGWWQLEFPAGVAFDSYGIQPHGWWGDPYPIDLDKWVTWTVEASTNGGIAWTVIDSQSGVTTGWTLDERIFSASFNNKSVISGTVTETLAADRFVARVYEQNGGALAGSSVFTGSSFALDLAIQSPVYVTVAVDALGWQPLTVYAVDALVMPVSAVAAPYYYKRLAAGTSGTSEPAWNTAPGGQCDDGAVSNAWERVERLVQPMTQGPLQPL